MDFEGIHIRPTRASSYAPGAQPEAAGADPVLTLGNHEKRQPLGWAIVAILLVMALAHLLVRGPIDLKGNWNVVDFANHYASARMWLLGGNPFDNASLPLVWQASGPGAVHTSMEQWWGLLPPGAYVVLAPVAALPPGAALAVWLVVCVASIAVSVGAVMSLAGIRANSLTGWLLIAGAVAAAPFQTLLAVGQASLPAVAMILLAMWCATRGRDVAAGVLLAVATSLKPQLGLPFCLFYLVYRRWRLVVPAVVVGLAINLIGVAQLELRGFNWWSDGMANVAASSSPGQANDPTMAGQLRHQMINLSELRYSFAGPGAEGAARALNVVLGLALIGTYAWLARRGRQSPDSLLSLAVLCAVALLPLYHRSYDAAVLLVAYAWALLTVRDAAARDSVRAAAWATLAALSIFLVPFDTLMLLRQKAGLFQGISETWAWRALVAPHHAWAALATCLCLIGALHLRTRQVVAAREDVYETEEEPTAAEVIRLHEHERRAAARTARSLAARGRGAKPARQTG